MAAQAKRTSNTPNSRIVNPAEKPTDDPVLALIDKHKKACKAASAAYRLGELLDQMNDSDPYAAATKADEAAIALYKKMMNRRAETVGGLIARLEYLKELCRGGDLLQFFDYNDAGRVFTHLARDAQHLAAKGVTQ